MTEQSRWVRQVEACEIFGIKKSVIDGEVFAKKYGIKSYERAFKSAKGYTWIYSRAEVEQIGLALRQKRAKELESLGLQKVKAPNPTGFVASNSVLDALSAINAKLDRLIGMWDEKGASQ
jgi:hypothetical protein